MTNEQQANFDRLEQIKNGLQHQLNLYNLAGYEASPEELALTDQVAHLAHELQKLARM